MRPATVWIACFALAGPAAASPALAQPVVVMGDPPPRAAAAAPDCTVEATGTAAARIRCRTPDTARAPGSEMTFLVSAQAAAGPQRCPGADVVRPEGAPRMAPAPTMVVEGAPVRPCA